MALVSEDVPPESAASLASAVPDTSRLAPGERWLNRYLVETDLPASGGGMMFAGKRLEDDLPVRMRVLKAAADSESRRHVWQVLTSAPLSGVPPLLESVVQDAGRVEVWHPVEGPTLEERIITAKSTEQDVTELVRPIAQTFGELHDRGLVYLQLAADRVQLVDGLLNEARLTRVEFCVAVGDGELVSVPTEPSRMPPEAVGLYRMPADEGLKAWDWWTLGRLIQELCLGQTIMAEATGRDHPRESEVIRNKATDMLRETDRTGPRAGGVELMKDTPDRVLLLLRGLLTSSRDARWGRREVEGWLAGDKDLTVHYELKKDAVLAVFHEEKLTIPEAAVRLMEELHWAEGVALWGDPEERPEMLPGIIDTAGRNLENEQAWLAEVRAAGETSALKAVGSTVRGEVLAAVAWTGLAPKGHGFRWRGRKISEEVLSESLATDGGRDVVNALLCNAVVNLIKKVDQNAAWSLNAWARRHEELLALAERQTWLKMNDSIKDRLFELAFCPEEKLGEARVQARLKFKMSEVPAVQTMFAAPNPTSTMLGLLALSFEHAETSGFITHEAWRQRELQRLREKGEGIGEALRLSRFARVLRWGGPTYASSGLWWSGVAGLGLVTALFWPGTSGLLMVACVVVAVAVVRGFMKRLVRAGCGVSEGPWQWSQAQDDCRRLIGRALMGGSPLAVRTLEQRLRGVNEEILKLGIQPPPELVEEEEPGVHFQLVGLGGWAAAAVLALGISWQVSQKEWSMQMAFETWENEIVSIAVRLGLIDPVEKETAWVKVAWTHELAGEAMDVTIHDYYPANEQQIAVAEAFAATVQERYLPETLRGYIAVSVPLPHDQQGALMMIDAASGKLAGEMVYQLAYNPLDGMWISLNRKDAVFLVKP